jgi:hypothetical protein
MKKLTSILCGLACILMFGGAMAWGAARTASASGNWSSTATWGGAAIPTSSDDVTISSGITVTVDVAASCATLTVATGNTAAGVTISGTNSLTVTGAITLNVPTDGTSARTIAVGAGNLSCGSISMGNPSMGNDDIILSISTGTVTVAGSITMSGSNTENFVTFTGAGSLNIGGTGTISGGTLTASTGTVNYNGSVQTVGAYSYNNLTLSGSGAKTTTGATVNGLLSLEGTATTSGTVATYGSSSNLRYNGSGAQTTGTEFPATFSGSGGVIIANTAGPVTLGAAKTISGPLTINSGATLSTSASNYALSLGGNLTVDGTLSAGSSALNLSGTSATIGGSTASIGVGAVTVGSGAIYTLSTDLTCTSFTLAGAAANTSFSLGSSAVQMDVNGAVTINQPTSGTSITELWNIGAGTANVSGSISLPTASTTSTRVAQITIGAGTLNANGGLALSGSTPATKVIYMSGAAGSLNLRGALGTPAGGTLIPGTSGSIFNYADNTSAQTVGLFGAGNYNNLYFNNTSASGATLSAAITPTNVTGDVRVQSGTMSNGTYAIGLASSKTFEVANGATFKMMGTTGIPTGTSLTKTFGATSTVEYGGTTQSVSPETYGHLTISGSGTKTAGGIAIVNGTLTLSAGTFDAASYAHQLRGNLVNNGTFTGNTSTVTLNGSAAQTLSGTGPTFNNLTLNNSNGATITSGNPTVNGALTITSGNLGTGTNTITLGSSATLSETAGQTVLGNIATTRNVNSSSTQTFGGIGADITAGSVAPGSTTVLRRTGTASSGNGNSSILRNFDITPTVNTGLNAGLVYHYDDTELAGQTENTLQLYKSTNAGSTWTNQDGTVNTSANTITASNIDGFSRWAAADATHSLGSSITPVTSSITPSTKTAGDAGFTITVNGSGFVSGLSAVYFNGSPRTTAYVNNTQLTATILAADIAIGGSYPITVVNSGGGGTSNAQTLTVNHIITSSAGSNGTISPLGATVVAPGGNQSYTITPATGYHVADVLVDGGSVGAVTSYTFTNVTANHTIAVTFAIDVFTITASADANGAIAPNGSVNVNYGESQSFTITPNTNYMVSDVRVDGASVGAVTSYTFTGVTANHTIAASFAPILYTLTVTSAHGTVAQSPDAASYAPGTVVALTATPATGYNFVNWTGDATGTANPVNVTMDANKAVTANYAIQTFTLTASTGANGAISPNGATVVNYGASQVYTITPATGYHVADVLVDGGSVGAVTSYTFTNVTANHTIAVTFAINSYTLVLTAEHGLVAKSPNQPTYEHGTVVALTATPATGYHFVNWTGDVTGTANPVDVTMDANKAVTANFAVTTWTITASAGTGGTISPSGAVAVNEGADQAFTIAPSIGFHIADVIVDGVSLGAITTYTFSNVTAAHTIAANFAINTYTITASAGAHGAIAPEGATTLDYGSGQTYTITPATNYHVADVLVDGVSVGAVTSYPFTNVASDHTIAASFSIDSYALTVNATHGTVVRNPDALTYDNGTVVALTATPATGYHFVNWTGDVTSTDNPVTVTMNANKAVTANFAIDTYTLTVTAVNGTATRVPDQTMYDYMSPVQLTAVPGTGYHFVEWTGALTGSTNPATIVMDANKAVTATFGVNTYIISAIAGEHGTISPSGAVSVVHGADQSFTITPETGYSVADVLVDGTTVGAVTGYTFSAVTGPHSIAVTFAIQNFVINSSAGTHGTIDPAGTVSVNYGGSQTFTFTPETGYHVADVLVDAVSVGAAAVYTFTGVTATHSIAVSFAINTYTITASAGLNGILSPIGDVVVNHGGAQSYTITPDPGYQVATLKIDGVNVEPATSYAFTNVTAARSIAATFSRLSTSITSAGTTYPFDNNGDAATDMTMLFASLPPGGGTLSISLLPSIPAGGPTPPPNAVGTYIQVTSTIPNHTYSTTVKIDLGGVTGVNATSSLACYNTVTSSWVLVDGAYSASDVTFGGHPSFTFVTDHFSLFGFIGTTTPPKHLYVSSGATTAAAGLVVPNTNWSTTAYDPNDWAWAGTHTVSVYLVPEAGLVFSSADVTLEWDASVVSYQATSFGTAGSPNGLFGSGQAYTVTATTDQLLGTNRLAVHVARTDGSNIAATSAGDYIARVDFTLSTLGHSPIAVIGATVQQVAPAATVFVVPNQAETKIYLGDIASSATSTTGDGKVDYEDLVLWSASYWSGVTGYSGGLDYYKVKYDIGPTTTGYVFSAPVPDSKIDFEDLVMFAMSYGLNAQAQLPKVPAPSTEPMEVSLGKAAVVGNETRIPVMLGGEVTDVRGLTLQVRGQFGSFLGVEKGALAEEYTNPVILLSRSEDRNVYVDLAVAGLNADGINRIGDVAWLRFTGDPHVQLASIAARTSQNTVLNTAKKVGAGESVPTEFSLEQNYPNPFNPTTTIRYTVPATGSVKVEVYNILGARVATLVDAVQEAGFYDVQWNGCADNNIPVASGVYLCRVQSGSSSGIKKMMLLK